MQTILKSTHVALQKKNGNQGYAYDPQQHNCSTAEEERQAGRSIPGLLNSTHVALQKKKKNCGSTQQEHTGSTVEEERQAGVCISLSKAQLWHC